MANFRRKHKRGRFTRDRSCPHCYPKTWIGVKVNTTHNNLLQTIKSIEALKDYWTMGA